jgi:hypothetical protein
MSGSETIQKSDIGDDDVFEIQEEFRELREEKKAFLDREKHKNKAREQNNKSERVLTGVITEINNVNEGEVELVVEYVDNEQEKEKSFYLDKPQNKDEFDINNKFVRIINFFGDRKGDPSSLKFRDIWLEKRNGNISIDLPDDLSLKTKIEKNFDRKSEKYIPDFSITSNLSSIIEYIAPTFITVVGIFALLNIFASYGITGGFLIGLLGFCILILSLIVLGLPVAFIFGEKNFDRFLKFYCVVSLTISLLYITGNYDLTYELGRGSDGQLILDHMGSTLVKSLTNQLLTLSPFVLFGWVMGFKNPYSRLTNKISDCYSNLKSKFIAKYRGIEYVET